MLRRVGRAADVGSMMLFDQQMGLGTWAWGDRSVWGYGRNWAGFADRGVKLIRIDDVDRASEP